MYEILGMPLSIEVGLAARFCYVNAMSSSPNMTNSKTQIGRESYGAAGYLQSMLGDLKSPPCYDIFRY